MTDLVSPFGYLYPIPRKGTVTYRTLGRGNRNPVVSLEGWCTNHYAIPAFIGGSNRSRTDTIIQSKDFKSFASTCSAIDPFFCFWSGWWGTIPQPIRWQRITLSNWATTACLIGTPTWIRTKTRRLRRSVLYPVKL